MDVYDEVSRFFQVRTLRPNAEGFGYEAKHRL